jgi:hypothetical protein
MILTHCLNVLIHHNNVIYTLYGLQILIFLLYIYLSTFLSIQLNVELPFQF